MGISNGVDELSNRRSKQDAISQPPRPFPTRSGSRRVTVVQQPVLNKERRPKNAQLRGNMVRARSSPAMIDSTKPPSKRSSVKKQGSAPALRSKRGSINSVLDLPDLNENVYRKGKRLSLPSSVGGFSTEVYTPARVTSPPRRRIGEKPTEENCADGLFWIKPEDVKSFKELKKKESCFLTRPSLENIRKSYRSLTAAAAKAG